VIEGEVTIDGIPQVYLPIAGRNWRAMIDTGFNSDLNCLLLLQMNWTRNMRAMYVQNWRMDGLFVKRAIKSLSRSMVKW
jgi:hypothetical protein